MTWVATQHKNIYPRGLEIYNLGKPFLVIIATYMYPFVWAMPRRRWKDFQRNMVHKFSTFYPQIMSPWGVALLWNLQLYGSFPYRCYILNLVNIGPVVVSGWWTTHSNKCQSIGDLIINSICRTANAAL